jgi:hypothetical protein
MILCNKINMQSKATVILKINEMTKANCDIIFLRGNGHVLRNIRMENKSAGKICTWG